jgi:hypothetical protein
VTVSLARRASSANMIALAIGVVGRLTGAYADPVEKCFLSCR